MEILFTSKAWEEYLYWQSLDKQVLRRINDLLKEVCRTPFSGKGKPEPLRHELTNCWSRRIDQEHRLVYRVTNNAIHILSLRFHYS